MAFRNPESVYPATLPNRKSPYANSEQEQADRQAAAEAQLPVWRAQLPALIEKFARIPDPRRPGSVRHKLVVVMTFALFLFVWGYGSRREANRELTRPTFWETFRTIFPEIDSIPHMDTVSRLLESIATDQVETVLSQTISRLMRNGRLKTLMVDKHYVVAIDGTQKLSRDWLWAEETLQRRHGESRSYSAYALEACLVSPQGIHIPFLTEFCENVQDGDEFAKQDCELKACKRLLARLRTAFPKLRILVVMDGLYPSGPIMALCRKLHLDFMIVLPTACLPSVWEEVEGLRKLDKDQMRTHHWGDREQTFWWVNRIEYDFQEAATGRRLSIHVAGCTDTWVENGTARKVSWAWVSSRLLTPQNVVQRCNRVARHRWDIEENILQEKHHGYQYEHAFSLNWQAMRNWHVMMHLGHLLNLLTLHTDALMKKVHQLGIRGTLRFLRESWRNPWLDRGRLLAICSKRPQPRMQL